MSWDGRIFLFNVYLSSRWRLCQGCSWPEASRMRSLAKRGGGDVRGGEMNAGEKRGGKVKRWNGMWEKFCLMKSNLPFMHSSILKFIFFVISEVMLREADVCFEIKIGQVQSYIVLENRKILSTQRLFLARHYTVFNTITIWAYNTLYQAWRLKGSAWSYSAKLNLNFVCLFDHVGSTHNITLHSWHVSSLTHPSRGFGLSHLTMGDIITGLTYRNKHSHWHCLGLTGHIILAAWFRAAGYETKP